MRAFTEQATAALRRKAAGYARRRARIVERSGGRGDAAYVEDMVEDVLADTLLGDLSWDPGRMSLEKHVEIAIRSRTGHDWRRAQRLQHAPLEALGESEMTEMEDALTRTRSVSQAEEMLATAQTLEKIRELAAGDRTVVALLDAICEGHIDRADLMQAAGMSKRAYRATRRRLDALLEELPHAVAASLRPAGAARPVNEPVAVRNEHPTLATTALERFGPPRSASRTHLGTIRSTARTHLEAARKNDQWNSRATDPRGHVHGRGGFSSVMGAASGGTE
jgi:hypothetical protein